MPSLEESLWNAAWNGDLPVLRECLEKGATLNGRSFNNSSPLEAAAYNAQADACDLLLQAGADPDATYPPTGETVLHQVITKAGDPRRTHIVKALIAAGAGVNRQTVPGIATQSFARDIRTRGETPLHRAAAYGDADMIAALVAAGADKSARDINGDSPLTWASWHLRDNSILRGLLFGEFEGSIPNSCA
ncbi:ankyrin repeat domain-containing protein [Luteolibacter arcticus]|uniref:Ankyrin repeat domain-containing protein n=1 Tax=Luteolibacter arcticus TaxID=1581411 RepID=A0ABT3GMR6_9BACT|nr:ankyrin repeat domain-containing protein [Luteolibacter arcticus]MCW1924792.1 ankyrin repeat domain-containing protein [Luteolibacter arcticus]